MRVIGWFAVSYALWFFADAWDVLVAGKDSPNPDNHVMAIAYLALSLAVHADRGRS